MELIHRKYDANKQIIITLTDFNKKNVTIFFYIFTKV
jgi:hypothetical protein